MKNKKLATLIFTALFVLQAHAAEVHTTTMTAEKQDAKTPQAVLQRLKDGNGRFINGQMKNRDLLAQATSTATGQFPVAVVLNCMDSRTSPEIVFDQGLGDIFAARIAGNVLNDDIIGSMEFGTKLAGAKLIVVMGHTNCGAVRGACQQAQLGFLTQLLHKIKPALEQTSKANTDRDCMHEAYINQIAKNNVLLVVKQVQQSSPVLKQLINEGKLGIIGAMQDVSTGKVTFFDTDSDFPKQS